jgi:hypothetical protein
MKEVAATKRRTEITIEKRRVLVTSRRQAAVFAQCPTCREQVRMLTPDEAATACGASPRRIYQQIEADQLHFTETGAGRLLICLNSLLKTGDGLAQKELSASTSTDER